LEVTFKKSRYGFRGTHAMPASVTSLIDFVSSNTKRVDFNTLAVDFMDSDI